MKVIYPITLDVKKTNVQKVIHANKGEGLDRKLQITLVSGNETLILDNENQSVQFIASKPDGTTIYNTAAIKDGKVIVYLTTQTVAAVGNVDCQLEVVSIDEGSVANGVIYSAKFSIDVEDALYSTSTVTSSNEFTELIELIERAEKQVTVFSGNGAPDTDPETYEDIKESDFYYDETNKVYYYATSVSTTVAWEQIVNLSNLIISLAQKADKSTTYTKTEVDTALDLKADKATTYTKTEVDTMVNPKARVWEGTSAPNTNISIGTTYTGIKVGDIYLYDTGVTGAQPIPCVVVYEDDVSSNVFIVEELSGVMVKSTNPPSTMAANSYIELKNGTMWLNTNTKRVFIKISETGEMPSVTYEWQDLTGNKVWFGDDNPDDDTALGKLTIGTDYVGISKGDIYVREYYGDTRTNEYLVINTDSTYAYLKKFSHCYFSTNAAPTKPIDNEVTANLNWKDWESIFEEGTVYIHKHSTPGGYVNSFQILTKVKRTDYQGHTTVEYTWDGLGYLPADEFSTFYNDEYSVDIQALENGKQDKLTAGSNISISNNTISATDTTYTAGNGIDITNNEISVELYNSVDNGLMFNSDGTLALFKSVLARDSSFRGYLADTSTQNPLQPKLTAGTNITIDSNNVISASASTRFEVVQTLPQQDQRTDTIYLVPKSSAQTNNIYDEYAWVVVSTNPDTYGWEKIGDTEIDLSNYVSNTDYATSTVGGVVVGSAFTKFSVNSSGKPSATVTTYSDYQSANDAMFIGKGTLENVITGKQLVNQTDLSSKQDTIDSTHKLSADNVDDTNSTNKFVTASEKQGWNDKADDTVITTDTTSTTVSLTLADNHEYRYTQELTSLTLTMPSGDFISSIVFASGSTPTSMTYDSNIKWSGDDVTNGQFVPSADKDYDICLYYNGLNVNGIVRGV